MPARTFKALSPNPVLAYLRKSTEGADRQSKSHEQQLESILKQLSGPIAEALVFRDSKSGTSFERRPDFMRMVDFCTMHPQPKKSPGVIWMYDESRFGRPLDDDGETDTDQWFQWALKFKTLGWHLRFCETPITGDAMSNDMVRTMKAHMGSQFSRDLSRKVKRGRAKWLRMGYWVGKSPWPAMRYDAQRNRLLSGVEKDAEGTVLASAEPSVGGCLLRANPEWLEHWLWAAKQIEQGHSLDDVAFRLTQERGSLTAHGNRWHRKALLDVLTNRTLIGELSVRDEDSGEQLTVPARWGALVPVELFNSVEAKLLARKRHGVREKSVRCQTVLENMFCSKCGARYFGEPIRDKARKLVRDASGTVLRQYRHPSVRQSNLGSTEVFNRAVANGCKKWTVSAALADEAARALLDGLRGSQDWAKEVEELFTNQREYKTDTQLRAKTTEAAADALNEQLANLLSTAALLKQGSVGQLRIAAKIEELSDLIVEAEQSADSARGAVAHASAAFGYIKELIDETRQITTAWESRDPVARRRIVDRWISSVWVEVDQVPGARHSRSRTLHFFLYTSPNTPRQVVLPSRVGARKIVPVEAYVRRASVTSLPATPCSGPLPPLGKGDLRHWVGRTSAEPIPAVLDVPLHILPVQHVAFSFTRQ